MEEGPPAISGALFPSGTNRLGVGGWVSCPLSVPAMEADKYRYASTPAP